MLTLHNISYFHPDKELLFDNIHLALNDKHKVALTGNNGSGKSTLLKIIAGELRASTGQIKVNAEPYYVPQIYGQYDHLSIAQALRVDDKLNALYEILNGNATTENLIILNDDWSLEERCSQALNYWHLHHLDLTQKMGTLSGGEKTKVFLAGISVHQPLLILLDEPSNHLDLPARQQLYDFIQTGTSTFLVVSHDRKLLNCLDMICELSTHGIAVYGGNYDFYTGQKQTETAALNQHIHSKERALRKAKEKERKAKERQQKLNSRGKQKQEKAGVARIMMNTLRNNAENSTSRLKNTHETKVGDISGELRKLRSGMADIDKMKFDFDSSTLHDGKILFEGKNINFSYGKRSLWRENLSFQIKSGERIALKGMNGSGKTSLIKIILGNLAPTAGTAYRADNQSVYIDQDYSLIRNELKVYEQAQQFNTTLLQEHEIKIRLSRFLFNTEDWDQYCGTLSGGERMRLMLCCLTISSRSPDIIVLDEPTNNLDIQNTEIMEAAINEYQGTLLVISHDESFLENIHVNRTIYLE